ncbi:Nucleotide-binding universal stress protein, UspA family [Methanolobus vulcani]|jgi:nucleotide-binding universal stress UspA family protein|uniref:Nucleotide-binding universal stress protein, UspA family n=1 Tax=Methanolobus vulcani TaxID=38026 RepID=A0A7Z7FBY4_9EURY|nr:universal stress protein [Methanolobus vulcani]SDF53573.1 Nucleotide-binding universal stress protein, UspA family [Methanolobus vulcani]
MKLLIPTDGSMYSSNAAKVAAKIAQNHDYRLIVLHVVPDKGFSRKTWQKKGADSVISTITDILTEAGCDEDRIDTIIEDGSAPEKIVEIARNEGVDRIVIGTQGKNGLKKIVGSVTEKVLQISDVLVLVVPPNYTA